MGLPLKKYTDLLVNYLRPQSRTTLLMVVLLLVSVGLQLVNPMILRYFIDTALSSRASASLTLVALLFIGIALTNQVIFFFKQKTAYEMPKCWSSDVCSSD